ncbi:hypothetical protein ACFOD9_02220 [Novosphingobium bradum]|uniref:Uncharacterized protein n=1 Tax=Novosphingobium bradum TaxID=1737444 RepID=A0ABV7IQB4_9SPHN
MRHVVALALLVCGTPVAAERLQFDHRLYPPLERVLDSGDKDMVDFDASNPARLVDLIAVKGQSARNWSEALEIVSIARPRKVAGARAWMAILQDQARARCPATFTIIAEDDRSVTFERRSPDCPAERASLGLYRLVAGKRSWFQLAVLVKGELDEGARRQWLALLASAHLD